MAIANVTLNNTYDEWRTATNQLITFVNEVESQQLINAVSNTAALTVSARNIKRNDTLYLTLNVSSDVLDTSTLNVATANAVNVVFAALGNTDARLVYVSDDANVINSVANAAFIQANTSRVHANAAYLQANTSRVHANVSFEQANTARIHANLAFAHANAAFTNANTVMVSAQSAFEQANTSSLHANAGFLQANTARVHANASFDKANSAFELASLASGNGAITLLANEAAFNVGNLAYAQANTARVHANSAFEQANTARVHANAAFTKANAALPLAAGSGSSLTGSLYITTTGPSIYLLDSDTYDANFRMNVNGNVFYLLVDRDKDGSYEGPNPLQIDAITNLGYLFGATIWTSATDGPGTGLNADLLDGIDSSTIFSHANNVSGAAFLQANTARVHANAAFLTANAALPNTSGASFAGNLQVPTGNLTIGNSINQGIRVFVSDHNSAANVFPQIRALNGPQLVQLNANTAGGSWNDLMLDRDISIVYSRGAIDDGANLVIGPWTDSSFGYKQDGAGRHGFNTSNPRFTIDANGSANISGLLFVGAMNVNSTVPASFEQANTARVHANAAFGRANIANITADLAFNHANGAFARANIANITADLAFNHANGAFAKANLGATIINSDAVSTTRYVMFTDKTSGILANANVTSAITFNPGTGAFSVSSVKSSAYYDSSNRQLLIKNSLGTVVWGN